MDTDLNVLTEYIDDVYNKKHHASILSEDITLENDKARVKAYKDNQ